MLGCDHIFHYMLFMTHNTTEYYIYTKIFF